MWRRLKGEMYKKRKVCGIHSLDKCLWKTIPPSSCTSCKPCFKARALWAEWVADSIDMVSSLRGHGHFYSMDTDKFLILELKANIVRKKSLLMRQCLRGQMICFTKQGHWGFEGFSVGVGGTKIYFSCIIFPRFNENIFHVWLKMWLKSEQISYQKCWWTSKGDEHGVLTFSVLRLEKNKVQLHQLWTLDS